VESEQVPTSPSGAAPRPRGRRAWSVLTATRTSFASSIRLGLLLGATLVAPLVGTDDPETLRYLAAVVVVALIGVRLADDHRLTLPLLLVEAALAAVGVVATPGASLPLLVCLPSTTIAAGLAAGYLGTTLTVGTAAAVLLVGRVVRAGDGAEFSATAAQWVLVALVSGVLATRIRSLSGAPSSMDRYAEARRLLGQLRAVTRRLPGSLDPGTVAGTLMDDCRASGVPDHPPPDHGAVLLHVGGDQLVPLAVHGYQRVPWRADLTEDGPITRAWTSGAPVVDRRLADTGDGGVRAGSTLVVLPISVGDSRVGVVALEWRDVAGYSPDVLPALRAAVERHALPLETAALFDELRIAAATEERSRLAREMHDGIAQDLAFLGYQLDALTAVLRRTGAEEGVEQARALRAQMTSLISDLRLSISDLRSSVGPGRGLGAALSEYARSAGTSSGIRVHLSLKEGSTRLPADTEVQLLRIAHEAVGRARRRPGTANLFVTLEVDPPSASLVVEDDAPNTPGTDGTSADRAMHERASKLGARFSAERSVPTGTRISVTLGGTAP
jgi:signal transduction histidine kinase